MFVSFNLVWFICFSEPPDLANWFSSYVYESPVLDTSDVLELYVPGESECVKETEIENETPKVERNHVCPRLFEQELVSSTKVLLLKYWLLLPTSVNFLSSYAG